MAGYGKFQTMLTFLAGLGWLAGAFEILLMSILGDFIACDWRLYRWEYAMLTSVVFIGAIFGTPSFSKLAETVGYKKTLGVSMLLLFLFGAATAFSRNLSVMLFLRSALGFALGGVSQGVNLCCEYHPAKDQGNAGFYLNYYWAIGTIMMIVVAWVIMNTWDSWHMLLFLASLPSLFLFLVIEWYPESAKYYLASDQHDRAVKQLEQLVRLNGKDMPPGDLKPISEEDRQARWKFLDLLQRKHIRSTLLFWYIWFAVAFTYYGLALMSPIIIRHGTLIGKDIADVVDAPNEMLAAKNFFNYMVSCKKFSDTNFMDLLWTSTAEFPGLLVFTILLHYCKRKTLLSVTCALSAIFTLMLLVKINAPIVMNSILFVGRGTIAGIFQLIFVMTNEAFPPTLSAIGLGSGTAFGRIGSAIAPFLSQVLVIGHPSITIYTMAGVIFLASIMAVCLPAKTKGVYKKNSRLTIPRETKSVGV